jgi:transposase
MTIGGSSVVSSICSSAAPRWRDCPPEYDPYTTIYNRFNRWAKRGRWGAIFEGLVNCGKDSLTLSIDSTSIILPTLTATLTTIALDDSSLRWLEINT